MRTFTRLAGASVVLALVAVPATAQTTQTLPAGFDTTEGNSSTGFPFGTTATHKWHWAYDNSNFSQTFPILITQVQARPNGGVATWGPVTYDNFTMRLGAVMNDYTVGNYDLTFDNNWAPGEPQDFFTSGNLTVAAGSGGSSPNPWSVTVTPSAGNTPTLYDPTSGMDFTIELRTPGSGAGNASLHSTDGASAGAGLNFGNRYGHTTDPNATVATFNNNEFVPIANITYTPADGLFASFSATPPSGPSPLNVQFMDTSFTSDPGGVTTWAWDLNGDNVTDSTAQNPTFNYTLCGPYDVTLTVTDASHPSSTVTVPGAVFVDPQFVVTADFSGTPRSGIAPFQVQFTDLSQGSPTSWAWDLNGDNVTDSTLQNPTFTYTTGGLYAVTLTASNACFGGTETKAGYINVAGSGTNSLSDLICYQFNEVRGATVANVASGSTYAARGVAGSSAWQGDPGAGRDLFDANEAGFGCHNFGSATSFDAGAPVTHSGSLTVMWWLKRDVSSTTTNPFGYAFGDGTFRSFIAGAAGIGVTFRGSSLGNVDLTNDVINNYNWQHVALVIDDTNGVWTWYHDGAPADSNTFTPGTFTYSGANNLFVGSNNGASVFSTHYFMDDFRMYSSALSFGDVIASMGHENASNGAFDDGCAGPSGAPVLSSMTPPTEPNPAYALDLTNAEPGRGAAIVLGFSAHLGGLLPIDLSGVLGAGCSLGVLPEVIISTSTGSGTASFPLPIPRVVGLRGTHAYGQVIILGTTGAVTNSLDINFQGS